MCECGCIIGQKNTFFAPLPAAHFFATITFISGAIHLGRLRFSIFYGHPPPQSFSLLCVSNCCFRFSSSLLYWFRRAISELIRCYTFSKGGGRGGHFLGRNNKNETRKKEAIAYLNVTIVWPFAASFFSLLDFCLVFRPKEGWRGYSGRRIRRLLGDGIFFSETAATEKCRRK